MGVPAAGAPYRLLSPPEFRASLSELEGLTLEGLHHYRDGGREPISRCSARNLPACLRWHHKQAVVVVQYAYDEAVGGAGLQVVHRFAASLFPILGESFLKAAFWDGEGGGCFKARAGAGPP